MNIEVRYYSRGGKTKKVAETISKAVGVNARAVSEPITELADILFLGSAVYAGDTHSDMKSFIENLSPNMVKEAVIFSTALTDCVYPILKNLLESKGIKVSDNYFYCPGRFLVLHKGHPNEVDLQEAEKFARGFLSARQTE